MTPYAALIRALDLAVVLNITVLIVRYFPPLVASYCKSSDGYAQKLVLGIVVGWSGSWLLYANLAWKFWAHDADPGQSLASPAVRLAYLALTLAGTSMHIAASFESRKGFWSTVSAWVACLCLGTAVVWALELWPTTVWRGHVPWLALTKALHVGVAVESILIAALYAAPLLQAFREDPHSKTGHFIAAMVLVWASNALCFIPLLLGYLGGAEPRSVPGLPDEFRILYLAGFLTSGCYFAAVARGEGATLWRRFWVWAVAMAAVMVGALAMLGAPDLAPPPA